MVVESCFINKKHLKNVGPIHHCEPPHARSPHQMSLAVLSHAACASMSTTSTTTTRDRGDRYGPMEWAQCVIGITKVSNLLKVIGSQAI